MAAVCCLALWCVVCCKFCLGRSECVCVSVNDDWFDLIWSRWTDKRTGNAYYPMLYYPLDSLLFLVPAKYNTVLCQTSGTYLVLYTNNTAVHEKVCVQ